MIKLSQQCCQKKNIIRKIQRIHLNPKRKLRKKNGSESVENHYGIFESGFLFLIEYNLQ